MANGATRDLKAEHLKRPPQKKPSKFVSFFKALFKPRKDAKVAPPSGREKWSWGTFDSLTAAFSFVFTAVLFIYPQLQTKLAVASALSRWQFLALALVSPLVVRFVWFLIKWLVVHFRKGLYYDAIRGELEQQRQKTTQMTQIVLAFRQELLAECQFQLEKVFVYDGGIYILLNKGVELAKLQKGDRLMVISTINKEPMGAFEVREEKESSYRAVSIEICDPLWGGHIRDQEKKGHMETEPPPECVALFLTPSEAQANQ